MVRGNGGGLIVTLSKEVPTILNCGDEIVEILWNDEFKGSPTIFIKASKDVGITGAHLLQKAYFERDKLIAELKKVQEQYDYMIEQRMNEKAGQVNHSQQ